MNNVISIKTKQPYNPQVIKNTIDDLMRLVVQFHIAVDVGPMTNKLLNEGLNLFKELVTKSDNLEMKLEATKCLEYLSIMQKIEKENK